LSKTEQLTELSAAWSITKQAPKLCGFCIFAKKHQRPAAASNITRQREVNRQRAQRTSHTGSADSRSTGSANQTAARTAACNSFTVVSNSFAPLTAPPRTSAATFVTDDGRNHAATKLTSEMPKINRRSSTTRHKNRLTDSTDLQTFVLGSHVIAGLRSAIGRPSAGRSH